MAVFENAKKFFAACEGAAGWAGCKPYVEPDAPFAAQSEPLVAIKTVEAYCDWMAAFANTTAPGATYDLHSASYDEATRTAVFFATYNATHTGEGGPVAPTHKTTHSHYVYAIRMSANDRVESMIKIWNAPWAMKELGWV